MSKNVADRRRAMLAGACFLHAYQRCRAASLTYVDQERILRQDQGETIVRTLTVEATSCQVLETLQGEASSAIYSCDRVEGLRGALRLVSCGADGTFYLVLDAAIQ